MLREFLRVSWRSSVRYISKSATNTKKPSKPVKEGPVTKPTSALRYQQRLFPLKKRAGEPMHFDKGSVVGYSTATSYNLLSLVEQLGEQDLYEVNPLVEELIPTCVYAKAKYKLDTEEEKEIFFFENGSVVFWNMPELERDNVLAFLKPTQTDSFDEETVHEESEMMNFKVETENAKRSKLDKGKIILTGNDRPMEKYAFSNGIAASVKLGTLESNLDRIIDSIEHISDDLKRGATIGLSREEVLQKTGEIFALRHVLNLSSDLLDTPDFYWDREDLENLYHATCSHLCIARRIRVMNEKISHCVELMNLISNHLNDVHHMSSFQHTPASQRNKDPILGVLKEYIPSDIKLDILEVSSGSGTHVVYFAGHLNNVTWQPSEVEEHLMEKIDSYAKSECVTNVKNSIRIDLSKPDNACENESFDFMLNINLTHISPFKCSQGLFSVAKRVLKAGGRLFTYGPFSDNGQIHPESNVRFDQMLREQNPEWGIRDIGDLKREAEKNGLHLEKIHEMPANNKLLVWVKSS